MASPWKSEKLQVNYLFYLFFFEGGESLFQGDPENPPPPPQVTFITLPLVGRITYIDIYITYIKGYNFILIVTGSGSPCGLRLFILQQMLKNAEQRNIYYRNVYIASLKVKPQRINQALN